jgi:hypothetical protein
MVKCADAAPGPVVEAAPAEVPVSVADSVVTEIEAPVEPDPVASEEPSTIEASVTSSVKEELFELKNAELRAKLAELGGGNGTGLSKAQLVDAILERLA